MEKIRFKGTNAISLENNTIRVLVLPDIGSKITSIFNKNKNFELLFQNKEDIYRKPELGDNFADFDASGFDDAFPTIDKCMVNYNYKEIEYPDHGEIWTACFNYEIIGDKLKLWYKSRILPYYYEKTIRINNNGLKIHYYIKNISDKKFPCIWAMHCLINCEEGMELLFPRGTKEVVNVLESLNLGEPGTLHSFPLTRTISGAPYRLDRVLPVNGNVEKYYIRGRVTEGSCSIYYPSKDVKFRVEFDKDKLPYLGFWVTEGGFRSDYNCAFEPTNGYYDSIKIAERNNNLFYLDSESELIFDIKIII